MLELNHNQERGFWYRFRRRPRAWVGATIVLGVILLAVFAPVVAPADPLYQFRDGLSPIGLPLPPDENFFLGTDHLGRDMLSRLLYGARVSLFISLVVSAASAAVGTGLGLLAGYFSGLFDSILMRIVDTVLAFPAVLLALGFGSVLKPSITTVFLILLFIGWPYHARIIRGQVLSLKERPFIESARAIGCTDLYIIVRHILPFVITVSVVLTTLGVANNILVESALSFLGVGVPLPDASWGNMIAEGQNRYRIAPWMILVPTAGIILTTLGFNLLGDAVRDALDPRTSHKV